MRSASSKNLSMTVCVTSIAPCVSPTKITLSSYLGLSRGPASSARLHRSPGAPLRLQSFTHELHDSACAELQNVIRLDFDTIADSLELFAIVEECAVEASQVLEHEPAAAEAERGVLP